MCIRDSWTFTYAPALDPLCGRGWPVIAGGQAQRVVDAIPQEQLDALPLGRLDSVSYTHLVGGHLEGHRNSSSA